MGLQHAIVIIRICRSEVIELSDISTDEYALVLQAVLGCQRLVNDSNNGLNPQTKEDLQSRVSQAMQALQSVKNRLANNGKSVPSGGSYCSKTEQKIYDLLQAFGVDKRIRIGR